MRDAPGSPNRLAPPQLNFYQFHGYKPPVVLVDVPGYGYAKRSKAIKEAWIEQIGGFLRDRPSRVLRLTMLLLDARCVPASRMLVEPIDRECDCACLVTLHRLVATGEACQKRTGS